MASWNLDPISRAAIAVSTFGLLMMPSIFATSSRVLAQPDDAGTALVDTVADGRFELTVTTPKRTWEVDEPIEVNATFALQGHEPKAIVTSGGPTIVVFEVEQLDGPVDSGTSRDTSCVRHSFAPGDVMMYPFHKNGSFDPSGEMSAFWRAWFREPELRLPEGRYRVIAHADYGRKDCSGDSALEAAVEIDVVEADVAAKPVRGTAVSQVDGVKVRLTLDDYPLVGGEPTWITTKARNVGDTEITYTTDSCENAVGVRGEMVDERWRIGEPTDVKAILDAGRSQYNDLRWRVQEWTIVGDETIGLGFAGKGVPDASDWVCADVAIGHRVPPGAVVEQRLRWDGQALGRLGPPPEGLAHITGFFDFRRPGIRGQQAVEVELEVPVTGGRDDDMLHPMEVVDAALADDTFRELIEQVDIGDHFGEVIFYDADREVWVVGACADYTKKLGRWKAAVLDPRTGEMRRFLNRVTGRYCDEGPWK